MFRTVFTKRFHGMLRDLDKAGKKEVVKKTRAAMTEAGTEGDIQSLQRTRHGETRLSNVEKFELGDGHRLVVQLVDGKEKVRAFLFVGDHADSDRWLDAHKGHRWVKNATDGTLDLVQVTERFEERHIPIDRLDLETPESVIARPLLETVRPEEWVSLGFTSNDVARALIVTGTAYEADADGIVQALSSDIGVPKTIALIDLFHHAHRREWDQLSRRIAVATTAAIVPNESVVASAMVAPENSDTFVTYEELQSFDDVLATGTMADWMLFLHPEQKKLARRDFNGPARLRGVSGSGKTSVLVHRARYLAKKYGQQVLLVTLSESMRKLLETLVRELCHAERSLIQTYTVHRLATRIMEDVDDRWARQHRTADDRVLSTILDAAVQSARSHPHHTSSPFASWTDPVLRGFLKDEISYVRTRLSPGGLDAYLDTKAFERRGRGIALSEPSRTIVLAATRTYADGLTQRHLIDPEATVAEAAKVASHENVPRVRAVLADEVQDLSQLELSLLGKLLTPDGDPIAKAENGLFLTGDGAQTVYKRGFSLRQAGIDVGGRSSVFKKNYRNTSEILRAAYGVIADHRFSDVDDDDIAKPAEPDYAKRRGEKPTLVRTRTWDEEVQFVSGHVKMLVASGYTPGQICIISASKEIRGQIQAALAQEGLAWAELRDDVDFDSACVKMSTIESSKGHEFGTVFIPAVVEGVLPLSGIPDAEIWREASRLYVAMTRARERLFVSFCDQRTPSRLLSAMASSCDEYDYRDGSLRASRA